MRVKIRSVFEQAAEEARGLLRRTALIKPGVFGWSWATNYGLSRQAVVSVVSTGNREEEPEMTAKLEIVFPGSKAGESAAGPVGTVTEDQERILLAFVDGGERETLESLREAVKELLGLDVGRDEIIKIVDSALAESVMEE